MKLINPFDRLKKRNSVPLSLFPASKKTATTMPIGRFVPLYCIDMIQGNRLKLKVSQLTRLMEMNGPLMQNFEVTYGAYFVPYVALDHYFDSAWFAKNITTDTSRFLKARDFFNPATPDSLRVPCAKISPLQTRCVGNGSLWQHLGYPFIKSFDDIKGVMETPTGEIEVYSFLDYTQLRGLDATMLKIAPNIADAVSVQMPNTLNFGKWAQDHSNVRFVDSVDFIESFKYYGYNDTSLSPTYSWVEMFGNETLSSLKARYCDYLRIKFFDLYNSGTTNWSFENSSLDYVDSRCFNLYRWLAYMRIYSDWCLNPIYTAEEDFRDMIGCGYLSLANGNSVDTAFLAGTAVGENKKLIDSDLEFFAEFIRNGECLPILWKKDQLTSIVQTDAASSVAIGSTIGENFYNRMYAKFKDLVARMGRDYRQNTKALYGSPVGDNSLQRSQIIGYKSFTVQVGEVAQTSESTKDSNLGQFAGYAISRDNAGLFDWTAEENGMVMICAYIRPTDVAIAGQVDKSIYKSDYLDYLIPEFGGVGYQQVGNNRFDFTQNESNADIPVAIGLEERYAEYMSIPNEISGDMLDVYSYLTSDRLFPQIYQYGTSNWYKNLYMWDTPALHRVFQNSLYDPAAVVAYFSGTVTRQLPATIRTDF